MIIVDIRNGTMKSSAGYIADMVLETNKLDNPFYTSLALKTFSNTVDMIMEYAADRSKNKEE
jgi:hypothetical protein